MKAKVREQPNIRRLDLTGPERRLGSAVKALAQISERFAKGARRAMPFLARHKARIVPGDVTLGSPPGSSNEMTGPAYKVHMESSDGHAWAIVCADTGAIASILDGSLGGASASDIDLTRVFGKELTIAQRALAGRVVGAVAEDYAAAIKSVAILEMRPVSFEPMRAGEHLELPKDAIRVDCAFEGLPTAGKLQLFIGAEVLEAAMKAQETVEVTAGDPRMTKAMNSVSVQVVAELGRLELTLGRVLALSKGETLRLSTAVDEPIAVRVAGVTKFKAVPVVSRGQLAVQVKQRVSE
jgi:flagellar motor switch protein FliM